MANQWLRLYSEIVNDPKVLVLTEALRWRYVALLCLHCNGQYENAPDDEISLALRLPQDEWMQTKEAFIKRGLIDQNGSIHGWQNRQYISDLKDPTAAERQKRYRESQRNARNATVTSRPPESDTDTEVNHSAKRNAFAEFWDLYPKKRSKGDAEKAWAKLKPSPELVQTILRSVEVAKARDDWRKDRGKFIPYPASWLNAKGWEDADVAQPGASASQVFDMNAWLREKIG